jgi:hypothetical protein
MGKRYLKLERNQASIIQNSYSCALCWSPIRVCHDKDGDYLTCGDDNCRCEGLIRTSSIEYLIQKNELFSREAREILQNQFEWLRLQKKKKMTVGENMKELGF